MGSPTWAYEGSPVTDGGRLVGTITLDGQVPKPKGYNLITLPGQIYCWRISNCHGRRLLNPLYPRDFKDRSDARTKLADFFSILLERF